MNFRNIAEQIFLAGVKSVHPGKLIHEHICLEGGRLKIGSAEYPEASRIFIIGAGKATAEMAAAAEDILGSRISGGHIVVKYGHTCELRRIGITEAGHPVPDANGFKGTLKILDIARQASEGDLVICLISGGGSALLTDYPEGSTPEEIAKLNDLLVKSGATIHEINTVRKHLSNVKGGGLARAIFPAVSISLILSDVPGDPLDVIASGPTVPDPTTFSEALDILDKYGIEQQTPSSLINYLSDGCNGIHPKTPKEADPVFEKAGSVLIGNNRKALTSAAEKASSLGLDTFIEDALLTGDGIKAAEYIVEKALEYRTRSQSLKPACLLFGGETTIKVTGNGLGGRNQHLALNAAILLKNTMGITILAAGTDGNDGPTDAAGAVVDSETCHSAVMKNLDPESYLSDFNSYNFFKVAGGHIITGPTLTNVMDIAVVIVENV
jgi:hydroxypyruvate reductase/glycerate 2-kinase